MTDYQSILNEIYRQVMLVKDRGTVASYIPELQKVNANHFGFHLKLKSGESYGVGDYDVPFSVQSISKVLSLALAASFKNNNILRRLDVEPSGHPFNQLALLEVEHGIPRNPFINSGAIVIADILVSKLDNPKADFLNYVRDITGDASIDYDPIVAQSEKTTGHRNMAAAHLLKTFGNLNNDVDEVLDFYFHQCALSMTCAQVSNAFFMFANRGKCLFKKSRLTEQKVKRINAIMLTCGFYDEAGEFAFEVGLPGKSGVGGGIVALLPDHFVVSVWSPGLNKRGNSKLGMQALEQFTTKTQLSIF
ncbi:glutaminase [Hyunsoonleella sp. SJ7]|uniref:Glutaminase n=1 Tax=Hyunsoonleella aquatilis TaxID=2762758 RepID=A0A923HAL6_9FLAO|nr:glutaminase [Hyunsoonleella aquatilis]MBC3758854.1 glutaminase [Hyunsoonleella aquatilis]